MRILVKVRIIMNNDSKSSQNCHSLWSQNKKSMDPIIGYMCGLCADLVSLYVFEFFTNKSSRNNTAAIEATNVINENSILINNPGRYTMHLFKVHKRTDESALLAK